MIKNAKCTDDFQGSFEVSEVDGKVAFIFETMPAVLFISSDGMGNRSFLFRHGEHMSDIQTFNISGELGGLVEYELGFCAAVKPE